MFMLHNEEQVAVRLMKGMGNGLDGDSIAGM